MEAPAKAEQSGVACSVCLELVVVEGGDRSTAKLRCGHQFHLDCIGSAFNVKGAMQCPNCRHVEDGQWLYASGVRPQEEFSFEDYVIDDDLPVDLSTVLSAVEDVQLPGGTLLGVPPFSARSDFEPYSNHWGACPHLGHCPHPHMATVSFERRLERHLAGSMVEGQPLWPMPESRRWNPADVDWARGTAPHDPSAGAHMHHGHHGSLDLDGSQLPGVHFTAMGHSGPPSWFEDSSYRLRQSRSPLLRNLQQSTQGNFRGPPSRSLHSNYSNAILNGRRGVSPEQTSRQQAGAASRAAGHEGGGPNGMVVREGWRWLAEAPGLAARGEAPPQDAWEVERSRSPRGSYTSSSVGAIGGLPQAQGEGFQGASLGSAYDGPHRSGSSRETHHAAWRRQGLSPAPSVFRSYDTDGPPGSEFRCLICAEVPWRESLNPPSRRANFRDFFSLRQHTLTRHHYDPFTMGANL